MNTGKDLDMGGTFDYFWEKSHPDYQGEDLTEEQYNNRILLRDAMMRHNFNPLASEWWHFTLKDEPFRLVYFTFPVNKSVLSE